jgi:Tol biopolymer transport system component
MTRRFATVIAVVALAPGAPFAQTRDLAVQLKAADHKAQVEGDLRGALELYNQVAATARNNRTVAARALLGMAGCFEKLGDAPQAKLTYERVAREYADEKEIVATAHARLGRLSNGGGIVARELWPGDESGLQASLAPDGRSVVTHAIRDISTGRVTKILPDFDPARGSFEEWPILSPDATQVAYTVCCQDGIYEVRVSRAELGARPRVLLRNPEFAYYLLQAWSPDGQFLLSIIAMQGRAAQLAWISVSNGRVQTLKSLEWRNPTSARLSPDGRFIAYDVLATQGSAEREIRILSADASRESVVVTAAGDNASPVWTRDGSRLVFLSNRSGTSGLWSIPVRDGRATGPAELVRPNLGGIRPLGFSSAGAFLYVQELGNQNVFVQNLDPWTGRAEGSRNRLVDTYVGANTNPSWSPDGKVVAYISKRVRATDQTSPATLVLRSIETGREFSIPTTFIFPGQPMWLADGQTIVQVARNNQNTTYIYTVDVNTGTVRQMINTGSSLPPGNAISPDGKTVYVRHPQRHDAIAAYDLVTGRQTDIPAPALEGPFLTLASSSDGRRLAYPSTGPNGLHLNVADIDGSDSRDLFAAHPQKGYITGMAWTPDNQWIHFVLSDSASVREHESQLWRVSANGGAPEYMGLSATTIGAVALNRDGTQLVFGGGELRTSEYWALENLERTWKASGR